MASGGEHSRLRRRVLARAIVLSPPNRLALSRILHPVKSTVPTSLREVGRRLEMDTFMVGLLGWRGSDAFSTAYRMGFSASFGGSFDQALQLWSALLCHGGAPSPRPAL